MPARGRFLLDSNIVIALLQGDDVVLSNLDRAPEVFIPAIVIGELFFGARSLPGRLRIQTRWNDSRPTGTLSPATSMWLVNMDG